MISSQTAPPVREEASALWKLAIPVAIATGGQSLMGFVDTIVMGQLSSTAQGAAGLGHTLTISISIFGSGVLQAVGPAVSQAMGAGRPDRARSGLWVGVWLALIVSAVVMVVLATVPLLLPRFGVPAEIAEGAATFAWWRLPGMLPLYLFSATRAYLQGLGISRPMLWSIAIANVLNLLLDLILVFGTDHWSGLGIAGAAISTSICTWAQWMLLVWALPKAPSGVERRFSWPPLKKALMLGVPIGFQLAADFAVFGVVGVLAAGLGSTASAAHQIAMTVSMLTYCVAVGFGIAASVRVGWGVGAKNPAAIRRSGIVALVSVAGCMTLFSLAFVLVPQLLARRMTADAEVVRTVSALLVVVGAYQICDGLQAVSNGILRGASSTRFSFWTSLIGHWVIGLPTALLLSVSYGLVGLWWGLAIGLWLVAIVLVVRFMTLDLSRIEA